MKISVLIPVFNQREALQRTLRALIAEKEGVEVMVVDLGSTDGSRELAASQDWTIVHNTAAFLPPAALNEAARSASGEVLFFLEPGAVPARGWTQAVRKAFEKGVRALHFKSREEDPASPWTAHLRGILRSLGQLGLGGDTRLSGGAVSRSLFLELDGLRPVPAFEWLAFQQRLRQAGVRVQPCPHEVVLTPRPGAGHADALHEVIEELQAAREFQRLGEAPPILLRRRSTAILLLGHDVFPSPQGSEYLRLAKREQFRINLEMLQAYPHARRLYFLGGEDSHAAAGQPSGVENLGAVGEPAATFEALRRRLIEEGAEALLVVRGISGSLTHARLRKLAEGPKENPCALLPAADSGEWLALWFDAKAFAALEGWSLSPSATSLEEHLRRQVVRVDQEPPLPILRNDHDARSLYYAGVLSQAPA